MEPRLTVRPHNFILADQSRETGQWQPVGQSGKADAQRFSLHWDRLTATFYHEPALLCAPEELLGG